MMAINRPVHHYTPTLQAGSAGLVQSIGLSYEYM
jgi:hypothetical protein